MKKQFLLFGIIACIAAIGGAFAAAYFTDNLDKVIRADSAIMLSLGEAETITSLTLDADTTVVYEIQTIVNRSQNANDEINGTLKITILDGEDTSLDDVCFTIYPDANCQAAPVATRQNDLVLVENIENTTTYYLAIGLTTPDEPYTADDLKLIGGKIVIEFYVPEGGNA